MSNLNLNSPDEYLLDPKKKGNPSDLLSTAGAIMKSFGLIFLTFFFNLKICLTAQVDNNRSALYKSGMKALKEKDTTVAINFFEASLRLNNDPSSYYELAKIFWKRKDFLSRNKAFEYMKMAVMKDENNIEYKYYYADLCKSFARLESVTQWQDIIKIDNNQINAWINLAEFYGEESKEWTKSVREVKSFEYPENNPMSQMPGTQASGMRSTKNNTPGEKPTRLMPLQKYSEKDFLTSINYYDQALKIDSTNYDLCLKIGLFCAESDRPSIGIPPLRRLEKLGKADNKVYQCLGLLYYRLNELKESFKSFQKALNLMSRDEREDFTTNLVKFILSTGNSSLNNLDGTKLISFIEQYWKSNDPLLLTEYNERLLEHYSRIAFANLSFGIPRMNIVGWKTNRGEIFLRYGEPLSRMRIRPNISGGMGRDPDKSNRYGPDELMSKSIKTENWNYKDFTIRFEDPYQNGNYQFENNQLIYVNDLRKSKPATFIPSFEGPVFDLPYKTYQFESNSKLNTDVYLAYSIDLSDSSTSKEKFEDGYEVGLFLLDNSFNKVFDFRKNYDLKEQTKTQFVNSLEMTSVPRPGNLAFEMIRGKDKGVTSYHGKFSIHNFNTNELLLSDIVLASAVESNQNIPGAILRKDISILPNPANSFNKKQELFLYYEIYNLKLNSSNLTEFEQKITIQKKEEGGVLNSILSVVGLDKDGQKIALTSKYQTNESDPQMYLQLDMSGYESVDYIITVAIKDKNTGKEVSAMTQLNWQNE